MFEIGNIQARPTPALYQKSALVTRTWNVPATLSASLDFAELKRVTVSGSLVETQQATMTAGLTEAIYFAPIVNSSAVDLIESASMSASLVGADYVSTISLGADKSDNATLTASLELANYELVIFNSTAAPVEQASMTAALSAADYQLV